MSIDFSQFIDTAAWSAGLSDEQLDRVKQDASVQRYLAGEVVCQRGSTPQHWLGVIEGALRIDAVGDDGRRVAFSSVFCGGWLGVGAILNRQPGPYAVSAARASLVVLVPLATFQWLLDDSRQFSRWVIDQLNVRLDQDLALIENLLLCYGEPRSGWQEVTSSFQSLAQEGELKKDQALMQCIKAISMMRNQILQPSDSSQPTGETMAALLCAAGEAEASAWNALRL
ncbi:cyclic nucleotide-binding domain-containing protein [Cupriavidus necator]|uniref:Cyclic nucleotide-binding domain-containing protein n=1 Tax=Cupriavidus necator TaxID=106590 RepID=A0A1U9UVA9_CUPNE|nr:cyclic nucleotide-binding domain-containing protein [Cupriavidus necator]AQV96602.1 cyclic nucleotide-binding domain-containing protein [Cupriavidus necator]